MSSFEFAEWFLFYGKFHHITKIYFLQPFHIIRFLTLIWILYGWKSRSDYGSDGCRFIASFYSSFVATHFQLLFSLIVPILLKAFVLFVLSERNRMPGLQERDNKNLPYMWVGTKMWTRNFKNLFFVYLGMGRTFYNAFKNIGLHIFTNHLPTLPAISACYIFSVLLTGIFCFSFLDLKI